MTITEANDINTVLFALLGVEQRATDEQQRDAAARLADKANKALGAGLTGDMVRVAWEVRA